ncbi:MAG: hypothetical protein EOM55_03940 [Clostridia bacterium]|nr:hypothetical protein [Clostridia bacterium]
MTGIKKLIISGVMVLITSLTFLGSSVFNISQLLFPYSSAYASTFVAGNTNTTTEGDEATTILNGDVITIKNIPTQGNKNVDIELPFASDITDIVDGDITIYSVKTNGDDTATDRVVTTDISETATSATIFVEICDPYGNALTTWVEENVTESLDAGIIINDASQVKIENGKLFLTPNRGGTYTVQYYALNTAGVWTNTSIYSIDILSRAYSIDMQTNDSIVMPTTLRIDQTNSTESWANTTVQISLPLLHDENGDLIEDDIVLGGQLGNSEDGYYYYVLKYQDILNTNLNVVSPLSLNAGNTNEYTNYKTYTIKKVDGSLSSLSEEYFVLYVEVKNSSSANAKVNYGSENVLELANIDDISSENYTPYYTSAYTFTAVGGKNVITYKLCKEVNGSQDPSTPDSWLNYTVTGSTSYDSENIELAASLSSSVKASSTSYKEKVYLPSISATNKNSNNNSINAFYYYVVKRVVNDDDEDDIQYDITSDNVVMGRDDAGFYFIPNGISGSTYEISYNVVDFYGNTVEDADNYNYEITITDRNSPTVNYVKSYDVEAETLEDIEDYSYAVASKYTIKTTSITKPTAPVESNFTEEGAYETALETYKSDLVAYRNSLTKVYVPAVFATDPSGFNTKKRVLTSDNFIVDEEATSGTISINDNYGATTSTISSINSSINYFISFINEDDEDEIVEISDYTETSGNALRDAKQSDVAVLYIDPTLFGAGTYTLSLTVVDGQYNSNSKTREFKFELVEEEFETTSPTVEFGSSTVGNVSADQDISIAVPTITDEINDRYTVKYYAMIEGANSDINTFVPLSLDAKGENIVFNTSDVVSGTNTIYSLASASNSKSFKVCAFVFNGYVKDMDAVTAQITAGTFNFTAYNDEDIMEYDDVNYANVGFGSYKISIKYINDNVAPLFGSLAGVTIEGTDFDQNALVTIPGMTFYDDTPNAKIFVSVVDTKGASYSYSLVTGTNITKLSTAFDGENGDYIYSYAFSGIKFIPTNADAGNYYTITYTLRDSGQNVVSYSFVLTHANDKEGPTIQGVPGSSITIELGQELHLTTLSATDNYYDKSEIVFFSNCLLDGEVKDYYNNETNVFEPREVGTFQIELTAKDGSLNTSELRTFTVVVKDTLSPTITIAWSETTISEDEIEDDVYPEIFIPTADFSDKDKDLIKDYNLVITEVLITTEENITIKAPSNDNDGINEYVYDVNANLTSSSNNVLGLERVGNQYKFTPTARGEYTITYSCTDGNGNKTEKSISVTVGDTEAPEIVLNSSLKTKLNNGLTIGTNDSLNINIRARIDGEAGYTSKDLYVKDNYGFNYDTENNSDVSYNYVKVDLTITNSSSNELTPTSTTDDIYTFEFETAGTYTLTFKVTDEVGNQETYTRTLVVSAASSSGINAETIIGTVLIVVSAVILVAVLVYFIRGTKFISKKKILKKEVKKD